MEKTIIKEIDQDDFDLITKWFNENDYTLLETYYLTNDPDVLIIRARDNFAERIYKADIVTMLDHIVGYDTLGGYL